MFLFVCLFVCLVFLWSGQTFHPPPPPTNLSMKLSVTSVFINLNALPYLPHSNRLRQGFLPLKMLMKMNFLGKKQGNKQTWVHGLLPFYYFFPLRSNSSSVSKPFVAALGCSSVSQLYITGWLHEDNDNDGVKNLLALVIMSLQKCTHFLYKINILSSEN